MGEIILTPKYDDRFPVECDMITPDNFFGKSNEEIQAVKLWKSSVQYPLSEFFDVKGDGQGTESAADIHIIIDGTVPKMKLIGYSMTTGKITVNGDVNYHVGCEMKGGEIEVNGNAGSWAGREMEGGTIIIHGNAGDHIGGSYRGKWEGMLGGRIVIDGNAGSSVGDGLVKGTIIVKGNVEAFCGIRQSGGLIYVGGDVLRTIGVEMKKGTIIVEGNIKNFSPGFFEQTLLKSNEVPSELYDEILPYGANLYSKSYIEYKGDHAFFNKPKGKMYVSANNNEYLLSCEGSTDRPIEFKGEALKVILNTGSTIEQGRIIKGGDKYSPEYKDVCAVCHIHPDDYQLLGKPEKVKVSSPDGNRSVVVRAEMKDNVQRRNIFIPRSVWANVIVDAQSVNSGAPIYKGGEAYVQPTDDEILEAPYIIEQQYK
ncbi:formylmethanofuran dehydrogenase subunit C [Methanococcus voltae]|uniref:formylmethanofuran dehydrogenase n=1 Tax=Methanococcus voltae (strain ATCC BAA-1334 / A3) TaxID=456320 RepID=D7DTE1_METV3|nr:formylmethanofuran dehydrogenase subunit C [Methanococcus voltae]MCS3901252.1 formylmethanofuran dehydrogenase subunit C [Methanococcus voltae]